MKTGTLGPFALFFFAFALQCAEGNEEFKIKREPVFEFAAKPNVTVEGDQVRIEFETKGFCDCTVAIENAAGRIVRHLACGVLGPNAPAPFQKNSRKQVIVWDGKDDQERYIDEKAALTVRVSLGLKPRFERNLLWSPHRRISNIAPLLSPAPEGVYVFEGLGVDHLRLFDHEGNYLRTVYPFPREKLPEVLGLQTHRFVQDDQVLPLKLGYEQASLLSSGSSAWGTEGGHEGGFAATAMAVLPLGAGKPSRIALAYHRVNRLAGDGSSGGLPIYGPNVSFEVPGYQRRTQRAGPTSIALSPDGKFLYLTGYVWKTGAHAGEANTYHCVLRMEFAKDAEPEVFLGVLKTDEGWGTGNDRFCVPTGVACDRMGRIYVADHVNQRVQIFSPEGKYLKTIPTPYPSSIGIRPVTGEIIVFSWPVLGPSSHVMRERNYNPREVKTTVRSLGTFEKPVPTPPELLPSIDASLCGGWVATGGQAYQGIMDFYAKEPTIWLVGRKPTVSVEEANWMGGSGINAFLGGWMQRGIKLLVKREGKWEVKVDFAQEAAKRLLRIDPPSFSRRRLVVNPVDRSLYVCQEQTGAGKSFYSVLRVDPDTGKIAEVNLPFDTEDLIFDINGLAYLCTDREIMRFDSVTWREIPWDYGEERVAVGFSSVGASRRTRAIAALSIPGRRPVWWHSSGMWISPRGHLAVICNIPDKPEERTAKDKYFIGGEVKPYTPNIYPGRSGNRVVLVFDRHGKIIWDDAVPGLTNADGIGIDNEDGLYIMVAAPRIIDGKPYFDEKSETLIKFGPGRGRLLSSGRAAVSLPDAEKPQRPPDISKYGMGATWVEGAEWLYGGVGYGGQGGSCTCWHARFQLDYFARSFAPEVRRFNVAVLDSNGNLILRIGKYGNADDGVPLAPLEESEEGVRARPLYCPIGGDEVALVHAAYVGADTDHRLYIADAGTDRILSVRLGYHNEERVALRDVLRRGMSQ